MEMRFSAGVRRLLSLSNNAKTVALILCIARNTINVLKTVIGATNLDGGFVRIADIVEAILIVRFGSNLHLTIDPIVQDSEGA